DRSFDLLATDVLTAADHHVLRAIGNEHEVFVVHVADVAGAHPAVLQRLTGRVRLVPVAAKVHRAANPNLTGFTARHFAPVGIDDFDVDHRRNRTTATATAAEQIGARDARCESVRFRHAVPRTGYPGSQLLGDLPRMLGRHCSATAAHRL